MRIAVFAKVAKHLRAQTGSDPRQCYIGPGDVVDILNPSDETAIEEALRIKEADRDTEVSVVSLGASSAETELRRILAMGADRALHIHYEDYDKLDPWATASVLARALHGEGFDLILCGEEAIDGNTGLVGPYVAEILNISHVSRVVKLEERLGQKEIVVHRRVERNDTDILACSLPALLAVKEGINVPRYPSVPAILKSRTRTIENLTLRDLGLWGDAPLSSLNATETIALKLPKPKRKIAEQAGPELSAAERMTLMMKGGNAQPQESSALIEGISDETLAEIERLLRECGVSFKTDD